MSNDVFFTPGDPEVTGPMIDWLEHRFEMPRDFLESFFENPYSVQGTEEWEFWGPIIRIDLNKTVRAGGIWTDKDKEIRTAQVYLAHIDNL